MSGDIFHVYSGFGDPVKDKVELATYGDNIFYGYFGFTRRDSSRNIQPPHRGFDYITNGESEVVAVGDGIIEQVRFGRPDIKKSCAFRKIIQSNSFQSSSCYVNEGNKCGNCSGCYGVQVWLKLDNSNYYAFYAHLSKLSSEILNEIPESFKGDTIKMNLRVNKGSVIGISGRSGNASTGNWPDHLHFECRKGTQSCPETGTQVCPNNIVHTQFKIKRNEDVFFSEHDEERILPYKKSDEHVIFLSSFVQKDNNWKGFDENYFYLLKQWKQLHDEIGKLMAMGGGITFEKEHIKSFKDIINKDAENNQSIYVHDVLNKSVEYREKGNYKIEKLDWSITQEYVDSDNFED